MSETYEIIEKDVTRNAIYLALTRVTWASAVAWQIYSCCRGWNDKINMFLSSKYWMLMSRVSLSIYLIHPVIQYNLIGFQKQPLALDASIMVMRHSCKI
jgi:peptidoglycan/LPS O-acetylase OafA/YrhL